MVVAPGCSWPWRVHLPAPLRSTVITRLIATMGALTARADARVSPAARALDIIPCPLHHILAPTTPQLPCIGVWTRGVTVHGRACAQSSPRTGRLLKLKGRIEFTPRRGVQGCGSTPGVLSTPPHGDAVALRCSLVPCLQRVMTFTYWVHVVCPHQSKVLRTPPQQAPAPGRMGVSIHPFTTCVRFPSGPPGLTGWKWWLGWAVRRAGNNRRPV